MMVNYLFALARFHSFPKIIQISFFNGWITTVFNISIIHLRRNPGLKGMATVIKEVILNGD